MINKKTSLQDIADYLKVSKNSVYLALKESHRVSDKLKERVLNAAVELNYAGYRSVSKERERRILILFPDYVERNGPFYHSILMGMERFFTENQIVSNTFMPTNGETLFIHPILQMINGVLTIGIPPTASFQEFKKRGLPLVMVDHHTLSRQIDAVITDNRGGGYAATRLLLEKGHRKVGFLGALSLAPSYLERWEGFKTAMEESGLDSSLYSITDLDQATHKNYEERLCRQLKGDQTPTAYFCANDHLALAVIRRLGELGLSVPKDVSIIGFDNIDNTENVMPPLTTVNIHRRKMGLLAAERLQSLMVNPDQVPQITMLGVEVVERESVREAEELE